METVFFLYILPWLVGMLVPAVISNIAIFLVASYNRALMRNILHGEFPDGIDKSYFDNLAWPFPLKGNLPWPLRKAYAEAGILGAIISTALLILLLAFFSLPYYWATPLIFWLCVEIIGSISVLIYGYVGGGFLLVSGIWMVGMSLTIQYLIHQYGGPSIFITVLKFLIFIGLTGAAICFAKFLISRKFPSQPSPHQQTQTSKTSDILGIVASLVGIVCALVGLIPTLLDLGQKLGITP